MYLRAAGFYRSQAAEFVEFLCRNVHVALYCRVVVMFPFKNNNSKPLLRDSRSDSGINCACVRANLFYVQQYLHICFSFEISLERGECVAQILICS